MLPEKLDGLLVSSQSNISYLTQFPSRESYLLITKKENIYLTDARYLEEAKNSLEGVAKVRRLKKSVPQEIADLCQELKIRRIGFEEKWLSFTAYQSIKKELHKKINFIPTHNLIEKLKIIKSREELIKIKKAVAITVRALRFIPRFLKPGKKEIEIAGEIERFIRYHGARNASFEIIVASGANSAFPHHLTSQKRLKNNEAVLIDMGVEYSGYKSDLTRVFFLGKINSLNKEIYHIVQQAQGRAIKSIKPGVKISEIDRAARQYIIQKGFGGFFSHNLGHSIGLDVHEEPRISGKEEAKLKPGMVFTIEPAIYLPGKFGVRLEDMVLVTEKGAQVLSGTLHK